MIHLGCCAFNFNGLSLAESLRFCQELGFGVVDVSGGQIGVDTMVDDPVRTADDLRALALLHRMRFSELFLNVVDVDGEGVMPSEPDDAKRARMLERFSSICACVGEADFSSVMGPKTGPVPDDAAKSRAYACLNEMVAIARGHGLAYHVEIGGGYDNTPHRELAEAVPGLRYTLDYAHSLPRGAALENVMQMHELTGHIHAKPAFPGRTKAFAHLSTIPWETIFADLQARGWSGDVVVECIAYPVEDGELDRPAFIEIAEPFEKLPVDPGPLSHPAFQTVRYAYDVLLAMRAAGVAG